MSAPNLSVCILTYNHSAYIRKAIEGALMQKVNFDLEIIIKDDFSTDNTRDIILEYKELYPNLIKLIFHEKNMGAAESHLELLSSPQSKYIAYLEGDDYWIDPLKLQKQVDFLEANLDYAICFHEVYDKIDDEPLKLSAFNKNTTDTTYTIEYLANGNFIHTPSVVYRNGLFKKFPDWFNASPVGDYVLHMLNAQHGLIKYMPEPMAVYRRHSGGIWSLLHPTQWTEKLIKVVDLLLLEDFPEQVVVNLKNQKNKYIEELLLAIFKNESLDIFLNKLKLFADDNKYIKDKWLYEYYPELVTKRTNQLNKYKDHWVLKLKRKLIG